MSRIKQFAGQTAIYGGGHILSRVVYYLLITSFLTHILDDQQVEFGIFGSFYAYVSVLIILFSFRLDTALFRYGSDDSLKKNAFSTSFTAIIFIALLVILGGTLFSKQLATLTTVPDRHIYVRWFSYILAFDIISLIPYAKFRLDNRVKAFAICKVLNILISSLLILFFLWVLPQLSPSLQSIFPQYPYLIDYVFISNLIASFLILVILFSLSKGMKLSIDWPLLKKMIYYVWPLVIVGIANSFIQYFAVILQEKFLIGSSADNLADGGVYDSSRRIASLFAMFTTAFNYAAEPFFFNNATKEDRKLYYGKICHLFTLVGGVVILGMFFTLDIIQYIVDTNYRESIYVIPILLIAYLLLGIYYNIGIWYKLSDKTTYGAIISTIGVVFFLIINVIFLPRYGYVTSAWATLLTYLLMLSIAYLLGQKHYPISYPVSKLIINIAIIAAVIISMSNIKDLMPNLPYYLLSAVLFLAYLWYVYNAEKEEWNNILRFKKN